MKFQPFEYGLGCMRPPRRYASLQPDGKSFMEYKTSLVDWVRHLHPLTGPLPCAPLPQASCLPYWRACRATWKLLQLPHACVASMYTRAYSSSCALVRAHVTCVLVQAVRAKGLGFAAAKLECTLTGPYNHSGLNEPSHTKVTEVVAAVRAAVGKDFTLMVCCSLQWLQLQLSCRAVVLVHVGPWTNTRAMCAPTTCWAGAGGRAVRV